jgi:hypothetical protein
MLQGRGERGVGAWGRNEEGARCATNEERMGYVCRHLLSGETIQLYKALRRSDLLFFIAEEKFSSSPSPFAVTL